MATGTTRGQGRREEGSGSITLLPAVIYQLANVVPHFYITSQTLLSQVVTMNILLNYSVDFLPTMPFRSMF